MQPWDLFLLSCFPNANPDMANLAVRIFPQPLRILEPLKKIVMR
jgi:hypothetical protein